MVTLCVYGNPGSELYAAVWVFEPAPQWVAIHGKNAVDYQSWITNVVEHDGYSLSIVSVTGSGPGAVFAAVAEKSGVTWAAKHDLSDSDLASFLTTERLAGMMPIAIAVYGDTTARTYAAVCQSSDPGVQWSYPNTGGLPLPCHPALYQTYYNAYARVPSRPGALAVSSDGLYFAVFRNDSLGGQFDRHGMTSADYQSAFNQMWGQGYFPVGVAAGGSGTSARFSAVFAKQTAPVARQWSATGSDVPNLSRIDAAVENFMKTYAVRAGQVAVVRNGTTVYSRGFTWGEPWYAITQPGSLMRIASCSKAFTCAAINTLLGAGKLKLTDTVFPLLGITSPAVAGQLPDARINEITVEHLVQHQGGWNDDGSSGTVYEKTSGGTYTQVPSSNFDPSFAARQIAQALNLPGPPSKRDIASYMYGEPLQFTPGTEMYAKNQDGTYRDVVGAYSNFGYMLLGLVVERASGLPYADYLRSTVLAPGGIEDVCVSRVMGGPVWPHEVTYDEPAVGLTPFDWTSSSLTPAVDGAEGLITELADSAGGLMTSARSLATFIHTNAVWGLGGRAAGYARSGSEAGCSSLAVSRSDGIDWAYIFNTRWSMDRVAGKDAAGNDQSAPDKLGADLGAVLDTAQWP
jgi:CubicO group peptidase (beta-lactamase class C family)